jgi:hypothetical protein
MNLKEFVPDKYICNKKVNIIKKKKKDYSFDMPHIDGKSKRQN